MPFCLFLLIISVGHVLAIPSFIPDPTFGVNGKIVQSFGPDDEFAKKIVAQSDGKIVTFVMARTTPGSIRIVRFNGNGSLDTAFGQGGQVVTALHADLFDAWHAGVLLPNGQMIVGGSTGPAGSEDFALERYNADGSIDTNFAENGIAILDLGGSSETINALAMQTDGKIVAVGKSNLLHLEQDFAAARFLNDGSLDTKFSDDGKVVSTRSSADTANAVIIQPDQKILIGGRVGPFCGVLRLHNDGSPDLNFGVGGIAVHNSTSIGKDLALQRDGKIISVGDGLVRFKSDGNLDTGFGNGGQAVVFATFLSAVSPRPDGSIVVAGNSSSALPGTDENFSTVLLARDGSFVTRIDTDFNGHERAESVLLLQNGSVITGGFVGGVGSASAIGLAKYTGLSRLLHTPVDLMPMEVSSFECIKTAN